jgi:DNA helicase-2/ATP-dependent DNA helicase PcrA
MDISQILDPLNKAQRQAVCSKAQNTLVLAGAGSGKTRVLVHRIAWLVQMEHVSPYSIMAMTFTNKAAGEMCFRIEKLLKNSTQNMWVGTFHGLAHRLLRHHWQAANLVANFQIIDSDDQLRLIKRIMKELNIDDKKHPPRDIQRFINDCKDNGLRVAQLNGQEFYNRSFMLDIYYQYEQLCQRTGLVDFAELLLRAHELWLHQPNLLSHYQHRFQHILVDEFQDTNTIQYAWIKVLSGANKPIKNSSVMVVGDDDQSIYGWRGAKIEHIQQFEKDFSPAEVIKLEQNYRSTANILNAANAVIENNTERLGKKLWTDDKTGDPIYVYQAYNEYDEAEYIVDQIQQYQEQGLSRNEMAILYRSNAQSRVLEEQLLRQAIPYRVYGGLRFFDRAEIRDALAYLRLSNSRYDDAAFERIINLPTRGIGQRSIDKIRQYARETEQCLWFAAIHMMGQKLLPAKAATSIAQFMTMIDGFQASITAEVPLKLYELLDQIYQSSGLKAYHAKENNERSRSRVENLDELINALKQFEKREDPLNDPFDEPLEGSIESSTKEDTTLLADFLSHAVLESSAQQGEEWDECVQLMTLHSAKGLEFSSVFLTGLEQGLFPSSRSCDDQSKLEEERRLCYVGITRAMKHLHISFADYRSKFGRSEFCRPSQFLKEIPRDLMQQVRETTSANPFSTSSNNDKFKVVDDKHSETGQGILSIGKSVSHKKFGQGVVLAIEGSGAKKRVQVRFTSAGTKWLLAAVAKLQ